MELSRREVLGVAAGGLALALVAPAARASAADDVIAKYTGGAAMGSGGVTLTAPEIAENGNTVPISVDAPGAVSVLILAPSNPTPAVCTFNFGPMAASQKAATRIRLAKTQDVTAVVKMADGSFKKAVAHVKVTVGGCGG
ncbi:MAG: thiosulfate oxidation carrier protein SoxY [Paracoccaceae bacterium]|nr:thiosulfate oxidation carrier protein SoxY [Paracoccaceae bacterium]